LREQIEASASIVLQETFQSSLLLPTSGLGTLEYLERQLCPHSDELLGLLARLGPREAEAQSVERVKGSLPCGAKAHNVWNMVEFPHNLLDINPLVQGNQALGQ
jgi:hypothetical protein